MHSRFELPFAADMTLQDARDVLRGLAVAGEKCPCCTQNVKVYERTINATMASALVAMWAHARRHWAHVPSIAEDAGLAAKLGGQFAKLRYWRLVQEQTRVVRELDGGHAGFWRVTPVGEAWIRGQIKIHKYARIYDGRCLGLHGDLIEISDALRETFDLRAVMDAASLPSDGRLFDPERRGEVAA